MVRLFGGEREAAGAVDPARRFERVVRPQADTGVACGAGEVEAGVDETPAESVAARVGVDEEDAELGRVPIVRVGDEEDAADAVAVELGDPGRFSLRVVVAGVVGDDARDERLEVGVPVEFGGVDLAVSLDDPAQVSGLPERADCGY